ncbi:hypothetical protein [Nocardia sp. NPDC059239]
MIGGIEQIPIVGRFTGEAIDLGQSMALPFVQFLIDANVWIASQWVR